MLSLARSHEELAGGDGETNPLGVAHGIAAAGAAHLARRGWRCIFLFAHLSDWE